MTKSSTRHTSSPTRSRSNAVEPVPTPQPPDPPAAPSEGQATSAQGPDAPDPELQAKLEAAKKDLSQTLAKKRKLDKELASLEATLYAHETAYLTHPTANSFGNIVKGYEAYVKAPPSVSIGPNGSSVIDHHSTRRKRTVAATSFGLPSHHSEMVGDAERVFSKSSGSYLRALESRNRELESAITSEQESVAQSHIQSQVNTELRKKIK